jgi:hypothetical protein
MRGFNPSFSDINQIIEYNIKDKVSKGLVDSSKINGENFKFVLFNSNLKIKEINFTEITFKDFSSNALFYLYYGEYKNLTVEHCHFNLNQLLGMTQEGGNFKVLNSVINISNMVRVFIIEAKPTCALYD